MKVIDLLNKIANGEEVPKNIKFYDKCYIWYDNGYTGNKGYCLEPLKSDSNSFLEINTLYDLNKEVEIIKKDKKIEENKEIEGLWMDSSGLRSGEMSNGYEEENLKDIVRHNFNVIHNKINEIIDKINEMREDK